MSEVRNKVLDLLINYRSNERRIALLRYEINHPPHVTVDEMIEALTFSRSEISGSSGGGISDKTLHIALNYEDRMNRLNDGALSEIAYQLYDLERQQERLLYVCTIMLQLQIEQYPSVRTICPGEGCRGHPKKQKSRCGNSSVAASFLWPGSEKALKSRAFGQREKVGNFYQNYLPFMAEKKGFEPLIPL